MIKKPNELVNEKSKIRMLIAGYPGIGKTTLALSSPKPLLIDVDLGINRVMASARKDFIQPESYEELLNDLKGDLSDYETLVIDTGGKLLELMKNFVIKNDPKNAKKDGSLSLQGYGAVGREFSNFMYKCYYELKKHVVIVFHAVEEKDEEQTKLRILVEGNTKNTVWQNVELGCFMEMKGKSKVIGFDNCERYFAKASFGIRGTREIPELTGNVSNDYLTKLFEEANQNIQNESLYFEEQKKKYDELMEEINPLIEKMETKKDIEKITEKMKTVEHILTSEKELKHKFKEKLESLGYKWNFERKEYEKVSGDKNEKISDNTDTTK
jgi:hypothetical protein